MNKEQLKLVERFESWLHGLHLRTLTEELKNTIHIEVLNLIDEIQELND